MNIIFPIIMTLWWITSFITHLMKVGSIREYGPTEGHLVLIVTTLPAGIGVFIYPIVEVIWGELSLLKVVGYTALALIVGGIIGNIIVRGLSATTLGMLLINPLAMICSIAGLIVLAIQYLP